MKSFCPYIIVSILALLPLATMAQQEAETWEQVYYELMDVDDSESSGAEDGAEDGWAETYELLETLAQEPLDLNTASRDDLEQLPFLSEQQVMDFIAYRDRYGALRSMGELRMVRSMDYIQIRLLPFFTYVGEVDEATDSEKYNSWWQTDEQTARRRHWWETYSDTPHRLTATGRLPLYRRRGDNEGYLGYPYRHWLRYEYVANSRLKVGIGGAQDAGEPFFADRNSWGYDAYTYYLQVKKRGALEKLIVGKFKVSAAMGLILNNSFSLGKVAMLQSMGRTASSLRPHSSCSESDYFQGAGAILQLSKSLTLTAFASYRPVDGTLNADGSVATLLYNGYHRSETEMRKKYNTHLSSTGGSLSFRAGQFRLGANAVLTHLDRELSPDRRALFRRYYPHGRDFVNASMDYSYSNRYLTLKGETATDSHGALATMNAVSGRLSRHVSGMLMQRFFSYRYTSLHGHSLSSGGRVQNESGVYAGATWEPTAALQLTGYADYVYMPWARYQASRSSRAYEFFLQCDYRLPRWHFQGRTKMRLRQRDDETKTTLVAYDDYRGRLSATYNYGWPTQLTLKTQLDGVHALSPGASNGLMLSQQVSVRHSRWQAWALVACFDTDDYWSRLNVYEQQLPGNFSFPMFYGEGLRLCAFASYEPSKHLRLIAKVGYTNYFDRTMIGTGLQQIDHSSMTDVEVQVRMKLSN